MLVRSIWLSRPGGSAMTYAELVELLAWTVVWCAALVVCGVLADLCIGGGP